MHVNVLVRKTVEKNAQGNCIYMACGMESKIRSVENINTSCLSFYTQKGMVSVKSENNRFIHKKFLFYELLFILLMWCDTSLQETSKQKSPLTLTLSSLKKNYKVKCNAKRSFLHKSLFLNLCMLYLDWQFK